MSETLVQRRGEPIRLKPVVSASDVSGNVVNANSPIEAAMQKNLRRASIGAVQGIQSQFFSPFRTRPSLETPTKRVDLNEWYRYYFKHDPYVGTAIELHATYPLSGFELEHEDKSLEQLFNEEKEELQLDSLQRRMGMEYWICGEAVPFGFLDDPDDPKRWERFILLDPDKIKINKHAMAVGKHDRDYFIRLEPDADLKKIVQNGPSHPNTGALYLNIPVDVIEAVKRNQSIALHPLQVSHFKREVNPFNVRGESIISRVLQDLMYLDKLRDAQYAIADRHVTPREYYMIGEPGNEADAAELQDFSNALAQTYHGYNSAIVWHHALKIQWEGAQGRILPLKPEFDYIEKRLLAGLMMSAAFMHGEGPCCDDQTEVLTENGWKLMKDVVDGEKLAALDKHGNMRYENFKTRIVKDYDGDMYYLKSAKYDMALTANHWQLFKNRDGEWQTLPVDQMPHDHVQLRNVINSYHGDDKACDELLKEAQALCDKPVNKDWLLAFLGFFVSEGCTIINPERRTYQTRVRQSILHGPFEAFDSLMKECPWKHGRYERSDDDSVEWVIHNKALTQWLRNLCGSSSYDKRIPACLKNANDRDIRMFLDYLVLGDGNVRGQGKSGDEVYVTYTSISKQLADEVHHLVILLGGAPVQKAPSGKNNTCWRVYWSETSDHGRFPWVNGLNKNVFVERYTGKVYCFEVPSGYIFVRRNGKATVTHNTFATASVALDVLIARYQEYRERLENWCIKHVYDPLCRMNEIYNTTIAELQHRVRIRSAVKKPWVPKYRWERGALRDDQFKVNLYKELVQQNLLPRIDLYRVINKNHKQVKTELATQAKEDNELRQKGEPVPGQPIASGGLPSGPPGMPPGGGGGGKPALPGAGLPPGAPKLPTLPQGTEPEIGAGKGPSMPSVMPGAI